VYHHYRQVILYALRIGEANGMDRDHPAQDRWGTSSCEKSHANILAVGCAAQCPRASGSHFHHDPEADLDPFTISISFNRNNQIISISLHLTEN
jgi:hypothetical protein